jgi:hypothetical protein
VLYITDFSGAVLPKEHSMAGSRYINNLDGIIGNGFASRRKRRKMVFGCVIRQINYNPDISRAPVFSIFLPVDAVNIF